MFLLKVLRRGHGTPHGHTWTRDTTWPLKLVNEVLGYTHARFKKWGTGLPLTVGDSADAHCKGGHTHCKDEITPVSETVAQTGMMTEDLGWPPSCAPRAQSGLTVGSALSMFMGSDWLCPARCLALALDCLGAPGWGWPVLAHVPPAPGSAQSSSCSSVLPMCPFHKAGHKAGSHSRVVKGLVTSKSEGQRRPYS